MLAWSASTPISLLDSHLAGSSSWIDFMSPAIQSWWSDQFALDKYQGTTLDLYIWNDMNEPSVFNGPEITMHKDAKHFGGRPHPLQASHSLID